MIVKNKTVIDFLIEADEKGMSVFLENGNLKYTLDKNKPSDTEFISALKSRKSEIIEFLSSGSGDFNLINAPVEKITPADRAGTAGLPLSFSQEQIWFIDRLEGSIQYHLPAVLRLSGKLNKNALEKALQNIVNRHEVLRTVIQETEGKAYQLVKENYNWKLKFVDGSKFKDKEEKLKSYIKDLINIPFDLSEDPMMRGHLISINDDDHRLVITLHHIASDGWSLSIFVKELVELYESYEKNREDNLTPLPIQYADYAIWQRNYLQGEVLEKKLDYWKEKLRGSEPLQLATDYNRPAVQSTKGSVAGFSFDKELSESLQTLSQQQGATLFMTLLSAINILLYRYSGQSDICVGSPVAGRQQKETEELIGFFINTLVMRSEVNSDDSFTEFLQQIKATTLSAYEHQDVPFEKVVDSVVKQRDISRSPLFQVMFMLQNTPDIPELRLGDVKLHSEISEQTTSKFDLAFSMAQTAKGISGTIEYCTDLYHEKTILRMIGHFEKLIRSIIAEPEKSIGMMRMLGLDEEQQLLSEFNDTAVDYPKDKTIIDLFEAQVLKTPDNIALVFEDKHLTYRELNECSNQLAHYLRSKGVKTETLVPICIGRSMEMITGILGILKAGGVYVPVDPDYPEERIKFILEDTAANVVVTGKEVSAKLSDRENTNIIEIDGQWSEISAQPKDNLKTSVKPDNPAYIIYTSGSTGKPKGVMIAHNNVVSLFKTEPPVFDFNEKDVWTMFHSFCFDFSVWEMYGALFYGGRLVIVPKQITKDASLFSELLLSEKVTVLNQTPSSFYVLQDILAETVKPIFIRYVIFGGEALNPSKLQAWKQTYPACKLINMYGITETTVHVTYTEIEWDNIRSGKSIIGKPIPSLGIYILDSNQNLLPSGIAGELCIAGAGLSRGYLNLPELTKEKFINNPFSEEPGARLYRSGDLGIRSEDGNIEYLGRIDEQVKIRGFRIELGEIESVLQESESVRQSVVLARDTEGGGKRLVGYVVPEGDFDKEAIMIYLSSRLPEYMVPALWVELESLPLTQNGKIDKKALPDPDASELISNEYAAPRNETEESLAAIWKELLHVERVGIHDNFFELGGDSIITIQVVSRARRKGFELKPRDIFIHQTISKLSAAIAERTAVSVSGEQGLLTGTSGLLPIQQWYFEGAGDEGSRYNHFNQSVLLSIDKSVTPEVLSLAVDQLIVQHDALRFRYYKKDEQWIQEYGTYKGELEIIDLRLKRSSLAKFIKEHAEKYQRSPDIEKGELVRFVLIQTPKRETNNRILIIIHHLAVDGVSWRILLEDLELLITGLEKGSKPDLGNKGSSYRQWYEALEQYGKSKRLLSQSKYWQEVVSSYEPLAADKVYTGIVREKDMVHQTIRLDKVQTQLLLQEVPRAYHTEINDILLCALEMTLCEWTDREKIVIGLEGHGRENVSEGIDTGRTAGWFTNLYPVLLESGLSKGVGDRISSVKEQLRRIPDKGLGYGVLKYINKDEKLSGKAWEIVFNYLGQLDNVISSGKWLSGAGESSGEFTSEENIKSETLSVNGMVQEGELILNWSYSSRHYEKKTIAAIVERYQSNLELLISHCIEQQKSGTVYTPSDYGLGSDISNDELDRFLSEPFRGKTRRESVEELYRLSGLQEGMLFHALYDSRAGSYIEQLVCDLKDPQPEFIRKSWNHIIKSHSILRSGFYYDEFNVPVQCVYSEVEIPVTILDYRDKNSEEQKSLLIDYERADRDKGFDFKSVPLMRIAFIRLSEDRYRMIWTSHHILFDGWSFPILMGEFLSNYELLITGKELPAATEDRYEDFIRYIERGDKDRQEQYWRNYMQGIEQSTLLPFIETTALRTKGVGEYETIDLKMDAETTVRIGRYVQKHHLTINTLIQGVWSYLLHCYTGNEDVVFGVIVSGRPDDLLGIEQRVGMYINTLPLHSTLKKEENITEWLQNLQKDQVSSRQYQHTPLQDVQRLTGVSGDLFDSLLVFENYPVGEIIGSKEWSLQVENFQVLEQTNYPLTILIGSGEEINFKFSYNAGVLKREHVNEIRGHFENVFMQIITNEEGTLNDIELLTKEEEHQILIEFNNTESEYPSDKSIIDLFEEQALKTPDNIAIVFEDHNLTYRELNERSNRLAHYLQSKGVKSETLVPICIERSPDMIAGIIGILKAGAAYVPVDPDYPSERISFMLKDTGASVILSSSEVRSKVSGIENLEIIETDGHNSENDKQPVNNLTEKAKPHFLAYVLYTSGSTGNPKGVRMPGSGLVNLLNWQNKQFTNKQRRVLQFTSLNFDVSFQEIFSTLCYGSTLCLISEGRRRDMSEVMKDIAKNKITHLFVPYIVLKNLAEFNSTGSEDLNSLEEIITAGEQLKLTKDIDAFLNKGNIKLVNQYGPTEAHVVSSYKIDGNSDQTPLPPIGKPIDNTQLYILRNGEEPVPVGVTGELHITGVQLARGYLNLQDLTKEKFIKDPFSSASDARMYRTGDLARWMSDGNIEYMGRTDDQIKIRGYRVELGEIESVLQQNETVKQAVVLAREDKAGNKRLTGYIVTGEQFVKDDLISYMRNRLPEYMIPGLWVEMESLPITPNGKIDKKALPDPDVSELLTNEYTAPRNEDEAKLANIWMEVLDLERVGINDNFFELGGHSLLAMRVISSIRKELGSELAIKDIFQSPTIAELAVLLRTNRKVSLLPGIEAEPRPKLIPMSYSQERLWFIDRLEGSVQYHMPFVLRLKGKLNKEVLAKALRQIVNRHEVLRTVIRQEEGVGYQFVKVAEGWELNYTDGSVYKDDEVGIERYIQHLINIPFDLSEDFMMRADLIKITDDDHILTVTMHHIASDGSSISVITREIADLYRSYSENRKSGLLPLPIQYIDYAIWQRKHLQGEVFDKKLNYWKQKLQDTGQLQLPVDFPRPAIQSLKGAVAGFMLDKELSEKIKMLSQKHSATLFMTLLTAYKVLLYRYSGQQDICVGIPIAGRQSKEMEALIGFFVNTLAIRNEVNGQDSFTELLKQVKATAMDAFENQEVPFEKVVDAVVGDRDMSKNPLVQVSFALQNTPEVKPESLGELILTDTKFEHTTAKFDLTLFIRETPAGIEGLFEYSTDLFREETIDQMISHFKELINSIVKDPGQSIETMPMLSEAEKWQQLYGFNDTFFAYPKNKSLIDLFEEQAAKTPDNVAVVFEKQSLTYKELNERSNQLAHYLNSKGVKEETLVPICIERGMDMITGILGILKSGAAYVPIDPEYPEERIKFILEDTGAEIIVSSLRSSDKLPASGEFEVILSDENLSLINEQPKVNLRSDIKPDNLAYIIYTSGSTGQPKGVMIEHGPVVNLIAAQTKYFNIKEDERILQFSNNSFDASVEQIFLALFNGASLILFSDGLQLNTALFEKFIHEQKITHLHSTPSFLENIQSVNYEYLKRVIAGGEICKPGLAEYWKNKTSFYNEYGPTETTVTAVEYLYKSNIPGKSLTVPIGKPLSNIQAYILDKNKSPVPDGIEGELYLAGDCLARGYLNSPELTRQKFVKNIFIDKDKDKKDPRMYRTGDLCRRLPDGNIEYLRRLDDQVKIRGYRIELGEIESVMNKLDAVNTCCVILRPGAGNKLVSYFVPNLRELKVKERELYRQQIEGWKEIHDTELLQTEEAEGIDEEFNIIGWNDSFTGEQIEAAQMKEWLEDITEVILSEKPSRVLEIGSGTGLIYYQLAEKIQKYIGTDFSRSSVNQITQRISRGLRNYCPTELKVCAAHEITLSEEENVDTIILNSVVQYFPGEEYMNEVIGKSISLLKGNGRIIAGDVRDNRLLELFKGRLHIEKLAHSASVKEFKWAMEQEVMKEEELCFSPGYFYQLQTLYPQITHIEIKWKQASYINELSLYRFTAVIYVGQEKETLKPDWTDWDKIPDKQSIKNELKKGCEILALMNVPNPRLFKERLLSNALKDKSISNAGDLLDYMGRDDKESTEVNGILNFAKSKNYHYTLFTNEDPLRINLLIEKNTSDRSDRFVQQPFNQSSNVSNVANTNIPLFNDISLHLKKEIRSMLQQSLPGYMIPSDMIALKQLPLTVNGKADRKFLMQREDLLVSNKLNYQAPETETEKMLVNIWQELLGADRIGIHDNFFELGGHSLLGMRVISAIRKKLEAELAIKDLFLYPTIAELSLRLDTQSRGSLLPAIEVLPRPEFIPLSFSQERLWFIDRLEGSVQYHVPAVLRLKGKLNAEALANSLQSIINRHEVLRTVIIESEGKGYQVVKDKDRWNLQITDGSRFKNDREELQNYIEQLINTPFDLSRDHMIRCDLINISEQEHLLVITMHHIASDGWSSSVIVRELAELYESFENGREPALLPLQVQYADYALWQRKYMQGEVYDIKLNYWKEKLAGLEPLELPTDHPRPVIQSIKGANARFSIDKELTDSLQTLSKQHGVTLFMTLLSVFNVLLSRYSGQEDICVGSPIAGRQQEEVEKLIGFFINTLALRSEVNSNAPFTELLQQVKTTTLEAYGNQEIPFEKVVEVTTKQRDMNRSPLFQVMFVLQNTPEIPELRLGELNLSGVEFSHDISKFDLIISLTESSSGLKGMVEYCTDIFREQTIERMTLHFIELLRSAATDPQQKTGLLSMLLKAEEHQLVFEFNDTESEYPKDKSIIQLFEEQASRTPDNAALVFENKILTYRELNERSNRLAHYLQSKGVKTETLVPVCIERSAEMITGMLGILKAGGAYVPIDPEYPEERIRYMIEDTGSSMVITGTQSSSKLATLNNVEIIDLDSDLQKVSEQSPDNIKIQVKPDNLAYMIYTSGSTGRPKGVMIEHRGVVNLVTWHNEVYEVSESSRSTTMSGVGFDAFGWEIWPYLCAGASITIIDDDTRLSAPGLLSLFNSNEITHCFMHTALVQEFVESSRGKVKTLCYLLAGGDKLPGISVDGEPYKLINNYGPTENTVVTSYYELTEKDASTNPPIGKPVFNTAVYILDKNKRIVPTGIAGEICISGAGLARGYLNGPELTKEKFINNPFSKDRESKLYRTGDLGCRLSDGNIKYLGRIDDQVKIRGYRIEPGEIESVLQKCESVNQAVVLAKEYSEGNKQLVGYVVPNGLFEREAIVSYLKSILPDYMVPALWVELDSLPLNANGKLDKKALPDPDSTEESGKDFTAPRNEVERKLVEIWENLFGKRQIGIYDNFFELGGHSLLVMRLVSSIRKELEMELAIKDIFLHPTPAELAEHIEVAGKGLLLPAFNLLQRPEFIPLSFSQERLWFIDRLEGSVQYHIPAVLRLNGKLNKEALAFALQNIVNRHEVLRTVIYEKEGEGYQFIKDNSDWELQIVEGSKYKDDPEGLQSYIRSLIMAPFDLSEDYMMRGHLISINSTDHILVVTLHHIASDGWSASVIVRELVEFYKAYEEDRESNLNSLQIQYADYAIWQRNYLQGDVLQRKLDYWNKKLEGVEPLQLSTDYTRPSIQSTKGAILEFSIDKELSDSLHTLSQKQDATLFMTLLSAFNVLLYRYSGQKDICVGSPIAGRQQKEVEELIGFFINTLALRSNVNSDASFTELLQEVKVTTMEAFEHQDVPFEKIVDSVVKHRDMSRSPLFQVMFILQNTPDVPEFRLGDVRLFTEESEHNTSKFDFTFSITETGQGLHGSVEYSTELYKEETIIRMISHYRQLLNSIVKEPQQRIAVLPMLTKSEEHKLLAEFNDTSADYPKDNNIMDLFEEKVLKTPYKTALVFEDQQITYKELNERSNRLAHYLQSEGIGPEKLVPVCIKRSIEMIVGILGILKTGAAYVPIDPEYPQDRINYMLEDTGAAILLTDKGFAFGYPEKEGLKSICLEGNNDLHQWPAGNVRKNFPFDHIFCVLYTSGSTGNPKGVKLSNSGIINRMYWMWNTYPFGNHETCALKTSIGFVDHIWELFGPLIKGVPCVLFKKEDLLDLDVLIEKLSFNKITRLVLVPSLLKVLLDKLKSEPVSLSHLKYWTCSGETLDNDLVVDFYRLFPPTFHKLLNIYGSTEVTADVTCYDTSLNLINDEKFSNGKVSLSENGHINVPIGKPIANTQIYILDEQQQLRPLGASGEICIGGAAVAQGYLNSSEPAAGKFLSNPFSEVAGARMYRTGDLGKWMADGNIEYLGRLDDQVKIRGNRIELGEIESALQRSELVSQAVVLAKEDKEGNNQLVGYVVPKGLFEREVVVSYLKGRLPGYMVPVLWVELERLPLNTVGKLDKKALPDPEAMDVLMKDYAAPRNETERKLVEIWENLFGKSQIGIYDNFFELGGHSLLIIKMAALIKKQFSVSIPVLLLLQFTTISDTAKYLDWDQDSGQGEDSEAFEVLNI